MDEKRKETRAKRSRDGKDGGSDSRGSSARGTPTPLGGASSSAPSSRPISREHTPKPGQKPKYIYSRVSFSIL